MNRGAKVQRASKLKERRNFKNKAKSSYSKAATLEELPSFQANGQLTLQSFKTNISKLFPLVLKLVSEGESLPRIEAQMGFKPRVLRSFLLNHPGLNERVQIARKIRLDSIALADILS